MEKQTIKNFNARVGLSEAYKLLGISKEGLQEGLKQNCFPFGVAVKHKVDWAYYIWLNPLLKYLEITEEDYENWKSKEM